MKQAGVTITVHGHSYYVSPERSRVAARANEILAAVKLIQAQAHVVLAEAENAVGVALMEDSKALECEVAIEGVRTALQALARGFGAVRIDPALEAVSALQFAEKMSENPS